MPHNVLDSPEKQPGAWKLPAHHLNSLIWALSGSPSLSHSVCVLISRHRSLYLIFTPNSSLQVRSFGLSLSPCVFSSVCTPPSTEVPSFRAFPHSFPPPLLHPVKQHQMPLIKSWAAGRWVVKHLTHTTTHAHTHTGPHTLGSYVHDGIIWPGSDISWWDTSP